MCGVTPYAESHVGHAMAAIVYDVLVRYLRWPGNADGGYDVTFVSNYTDVDDNVIARAAEVGRDPLELVGENIDEWEEQQRALNLVFPDVRPRVTTHIETIVAATEAIVERGFGYATGAGDVYFRVRAHPQARLREALAPRHRPAALGDALRARRGQGVPPRLRAVEGDEAG